MKYSSSTEVNKGHRYQITKWQGPIVLKPHHPGSWAVMSLPENMDICNVIKSAGVGGGEQITVCIYYKNCYLFFPRCITDYNKNIPGHKRLAWRYSKGTGMVRLQDLVSKWMLYKVGIWSCAAFQVPPIHQRRLISGSWTSLRRITD